MLYEKIQEICDSKGITVSGLEKDLGFSNSTIRKWKNSSPSIENLKKVADYFGITVDELISGEKERRRTMRSHTCRIWQIIWIG